MLSCHNRRNLLTALCLAAVAAGLLPAVGPVPAAAYGQNKTKEPPAPPPPVVIRFVSGQRARYFGNDVLVLEGVGALDGRAMKVAVRNTDAKSNKYEPNANHASEINSLKPGDYAKIEVEPKDNQVWLKKIESYKVTPGEELPGTFIFNETYTKTEGSTDYQFVTLTKLGQVIDCVVPAKRNESKQMVPDAALVEKAGKFKKGDIVEAELQPGRPFATITVIDAYTAPQPAKMVKVGETEIDGQKYPSVDLDQDGKAVSLAVNGKLSGKKLVADARVLSSAKSIRAGTEVMFRTREDGGRLWLKEIKPAPKQTTTAKPGAKDPKMESEK